MGRQFIMDKEVGMSRELMAERLIDSIDNVLTNFKTRERFELFLA